MVHVHNQFHFIVFSVYLTICNVSLKQSEEKQRSSLI
jgi:hypothetical protein